MNIHSQAKRRSNSDAEIIDSKSPIRTSFQTADELAVLGRQLASQKQTTLIGFFGLRYPGRLAENERAILENYEAIAEASRRKELITPAAEWLLDHHHTVKETFRQVRRDLPVKFFRQLPEMEVENGGHLPRTFALTWDYAAHTDSTFTPDTLTAIVEGFQEIETLTIGEIWAIPAILRYVLLENLRRLSDRVDVSRRMRDKASRFADFLSSDRKEANLHTALQNHRQYTADDSFSAQLLYRLREDSGAASEALSWLEEALEDRNCDAEEVIVLEHTRISTGNLTVGNIIRSLKRIDDFDWAVWFEDISKVDVALRDASDFADLDPRTRNYYRTEIERIARRSPKSELEVANLALEMSVGSRSGDARRDNVGFYLAGKGIPQLEEAASYRRKLADRLYRGIRSAGLAALVLPILALTAIILISVGWILSTTLLGATGIAFMIVALVLPAWEASTALYRAVMNSVLPPSYLPGYEFKSGVPAEARALVAIPCLISNRDTISALVRNLEVHYLANPDQEIFYALVTDWADSPTEEAPNDRELLNFAQSEIDEVALKYAAAGPRRFFLVHRRRLYNPSEACWMGWERKRGKLHELNLLLRGDHDTTFFDPAAPLPENIQYVLTLDSDTRLPRDSARTLIGKLAHPLNAPVFDPVTHRVAEGYGILQPRITPSLTTGDEASVFQRIFSRDRGLDPYVFAVSDIYQDLFDEGSFTGKGLYHVDAFEAALEGRIEENTVLSHDLLEGSFARSALVTDIAFVEDFPVRYEVEASRQHRWTRGDWQLLPFIIGLNAGVTSLSRFKMMDNLRRSLTPAAWIVASLLGWCLLGPGHAAAWQLILIATMFVAPVVSMISGVVPRQVGVAPDSHARAVLEDFTGMMAQIALSVAFMAHTAGLMLDAIGRSLHRMYVSRASLLEWRTAQQVGAANTSGFGRHFGLMWVSPIIGLGFIAIVLISNPANAYSAAVIGLIWIIAPALAWWTSQTLENEDRLHVSESDALALRVVGRRTWRFFESFVTAEHNFLPPDNFQERPEPFVAARTSPTNIGLYMLSTVTARDMGWIGFLDCVDRLQRTIETVEKMEKFRGHLFNWYDTRDLRVMHPQYVSAVDSGNLAGHLIVVSSTLKEWSAGVATHLIGDVRGIGDSARVVRETLAEIPDDRRSIRPLRRRLEERVEGFDKTLNSYLAEPELAPVRTIGLSVVASEIEGFAGDLDREIGSASTALLVEWSQHLHKNCEAHFADAVFDRAGQDALCARLAALGERARALAFGMDFGFLFNRERRLFSIGYRADENKMDESCYDLLASEARLTSLFAIAKGDVPSEHWFRLGRPVTVVGGRATLVSWSGSMFEYLMPPVVMHERQGGILNQSDNLSIERQISYGKSLGIPWGVSESAYHARDREMNYQYHNFGVPGLGLKRDLGNNVVIAPYASLLASQFKPREAVVNLARLNAFGALGVYGYYDAVDFTGSRLPEGKSYAVVHNYMAHHQGMSITAIGNAILNGRLRDRFHADPVIEAAELLLQEKAPRAAIPVRTPDAGEPLTEVTERLGAQKYRVIDDPLRRPRSISVMSNGHYSIMLTAAGSGYAMWNGLAVTRWRADPTVDDWGTHIFLRDTKSGEWWSAAPGPRPLAGEEARAVLTDEKAEFVKSAGTIRTKLECIVATEADAEGRRLTITNTGPIDRQIEVTSYGEFVLSSADSDTAHPAFSKMFIKTEIGERGDVIFARRNKRNHDEPDIEVAHLIVGGASRAPIQAETDRRAFIGRGRQLCDARAFDRGARLEGNQGFTLDPIFSLRKTIRVPAGKEATIIYWTIAAPNRTVLEDQVARYRHAENFDHEAQHAWTRSQVQMRHLDTTHAEALLFQRVASYLVYPDTRLRQTQTPGNVVTAPQSSLWPMSISGDFPIFALRIDDEGDLAIIQKAFRMQEYLRARGVISDLVIINERASSYAQDVQHAIDFMCDNARRRGLASGPAQHIFSVRRDLMEPATYEALVSAARIVLHTRNGSISEQIDRLERMTQDDAENLDRIKVGGASSRSKPVARTAGVAANQNDIFPIDGSDLLFWNGYGGFDPASRDYVIRLRAGTSTPHPWINVISNGSFGFHISAEGAAFTWSSNSRDYQLTPWSNDTVVNRPSEAFYVHDIGSHEVFSPFAALAKNGEATYEVRHGPGRSVFRSEDRGLELEMTQIVAAKDPAKMMRLRITNKTEQERKLRVYAYAEWVLGNNRARTAPYVRNWHEPAINGLMAQNPFSIDNSNRTSFLAVNRPLQSYTAARGEFLSGQSDTFEPSAVMFGHGLSNSVESSGDPCAALAVDITVKSGGTEEVTFVLGDVETEMDAVPLIKALLDVGFEREKEQAQEEWEKFLGTLQVSTPDPAFDRMVNTWLPYQNLACRIRARSAFYQASGAFGFRDQLQDTLALMLHDPSLARAQIINAASRQFPEGDVQHWWLPKSGAGVRTLISDDVVWLGYAISLYLSVTGDATLLDEEIAFLKGPELGDKHESFFPPEISEEKVSLYEHCVKALDLAVARTGEHGLPLILGGDWNDGMNRVGTEGKGESTWLGWFLALTLDRMIPIAEGRNDASHAKTWAKHRRELGAALEANAWDGEWYRRGYFDDGSPLGSKDSEECQIDSIAQSWSVISGAGDPGRREIAMASVAEKLIDEEAKIIRLFTPPFENSDKDPGYIKSYPPGVRENGGQYTHAAIWVAYALARMGRGDEAYRAFSLLNPINHALTQDDAEQYRVEPYVVAADIYGAADRTGRGGWTWYTGSAGWLYRTAVEAILGIRKQGDRIVVEPVLPDAWPGFEAVINVDEHRYEIKVERGDAGSFKIFANGQLTENGSISLGGQDRSLPG
jgi:cyclic beta-1,2-glucan synthetase